MKENNIYNQNPSQQLATDFLRELYAPLLEVQLENIARLETQIRELEAERNTCIGLYEAYYLEGGF